MNEAMKGLPRHTRRELLDKEARRRKSGNWGEWEALPLNSGIPGTTGWCRQVRHAVKNAVFSVLVRPLESGGVHLAVSSLSGVRPTWHEMQRIKDDILGFSATAVEIYPPRSQVVDAADVFHLWSGVELPADWSIFEGQKKSEAAA